MTRKFRNTGGRDVTDETEAALWQAIDAAPEGVLRRLVRREPVAEVVVSDREPHPNSYAGSTVCAWQAETSDPLMSSSTSHVPYGLLKIMAELDGDDLDGRTWLTFPTPDAARSALSSALLTWAAQPEEVPA